MPYFHGENLAKFRVWCAMAHQQGFVSVYMVPIDMLVWCVLMWVSYMGKLMSLVDIDWDNHTAMIVHTI